MDTRSCGSAVRFAAELRALRDEAGRPTYRQMARRACCSAATLCRAVAGQRLPSLDVVLAFVDACGGDRVVWAAKWRAAAAEHSAHRADADPGAPPRPQAAGSREVPAIPAQLPPATAGFVGRAREMAALHALITGAVAGSPDAAGVAAIAAISGPAGTGKTTLAVHFGHRVASRYPDGQLFLDLRGFDLDPAIPTDEALGLLLAGLGVAPQAVPAGTTERTLLYRSLVATRRLLVVLDNAQSAEQVRALLPGGPGCLGIVTGRKLMTGLSVLYGVRQVTLDVLSTQDALALLAAILGRDRLAAEPGAAEDLATLCGHLPLALRIVAANLLASPARPISEIVAELTKGDRLAQLEVDEGPAVSASFDLSYQRLAGPAARLFRLLSLVPGPHFAAGAVAALAAVTGEEAERLLSHLHAMQLIQLAAPRRYRFHSLVRLFASERSRMTDSEADRDAAISRLGAYYLAGTAAATRHLGAGGLRLPDMVAQAGDDAPAAGPQSLAWLDDERPNVVALVRLASTEPAHWPLAWELVNRLHMYFDARRHVADGFAVVEAGLAAALSAGNRLAEAAMRASRATGYRNQGRYRHAAEEYALALRASRDCGWRAGEASILGDIAWVREELDPPAQAIENYQRALRAYAAIGDSFGEASVLTKFGGNLLWKLGRLEEASECLARALALHERAGSRLRAAACRANLGNVVHEMGRFDQALALFTEALAVHQELGARAGEAIDLCDLGGVHRDLGRFDESLDYGLRALELSRDIGDQRVEAECLNALADYHVRTGSPDRAAECARRARQITRDTGYRYGQARSEIRLGWALLLGGKPGPAARQAASVLARTRQHGYRMLEGNALTLSSKAALDCGDAQAAADLARRATALLRETGHLPGESVALRVLDEARAKAQEDARALEPDTAPRPSGAPFASGTGS